MRDVTLTEDEKTTMEYLSIMSSVINSCWRMYNTDIVFYDALSHLTYNNKMQELDMRQKISKRLGIKPTFSFREGEIVEYEHQER